MNSKFTFSGLVILSSIFLLTTPGLTFPQQSEVEIAQVNSSQAEKYAEALRLLQQGVQLFQQGTFESLQEAIFLWKQALPIFQEIGKSLDEATTFLAIGRVYSLFGENKQALDYYNQALLLFREVGDRGLEADALNNIGLVYDSLGEKQQALNYYNQALPIRLEVGDRIGEATTLANLGLVYDSLGEKQQALNYYNQALPIVREVGDRRKEATTFNNLGRVYDSLGDKQQALDYYNQALPIRREVGDLRGEATTLNNLGRVYDSLGDEQQAIDYYNQALPIFREVGDIRGEAGTLNNLGLSYKSLGKIKQALDYYNQALPILRQVSNREGEAITLINLGAVYNSLREQKQALDYYNQALSILRQVGNRQNEAIVLDAIGAFYDLLGEQKQALDYYNQALPIRREVGDIKGEAITLINIAFLQKNQDNIQEALKNIDSAITLVEQIRTNIASPELKTSFFATVENYYKLKTEILMELHQQNPDKNYDKLAFENSERGKARTLLDLLTEANIDIRKGVEPKLVSQERRLRFKLDSIEQRRVELCNQGCFPKQLAKLETEREQLLDQYRQIQSQIRATSPEYAELTQPEPLKLKQLQKLLDQDTVLLQYSLWRDRSYVWVISRETFTSYQLASREDIESVAKQFYELSKYATEEKLDTLKTLGTELSQLILEPIAQQLNKKRIVVVGDGILHYIPFTSLPLSKEKNNLLIDNYQIVNLPSSSVLQRLRQNQKTRKPAPKQIAIFADPVFDKKDERLREQPQFTPSSTQIAFNIFDPHRSARSMELFLGRLPGTRREAKAILPLFSEDKTSYAFDFDANRNLAISDELSQYQIIHFATHGIANSVRPELSGIILSLVNSQGEAINGFLRLHDLFNLNLAADLVVLSACETGLGQEIKGEGIVGLTRGFMYAGANKLLVSLWNVDDDATAEMMTRFYNLMLKDSLSPAEALREAQQEIRKQEKWQHPKYWAAFTLQGDW